MATPDPVQVSMYAALSRAAYQGEAVPLGWSIIKTESLSSGFAATAFKNESGEIVVAYRGTDEFKDLTGPDLDIALQNTPGQLEAAKDFLNRIQSDPDNQGSTVTLTGHSLGGALAQLVAALKGNIAYTYNAPGVNLILQDLPENPNPGADPSTFTNINNFNMRLDLVHARGDQLGMAYNYEPTTLEGIQFFTGVMAALVNPTVGVVILANGALGQH